MKKLVALAVFPLALLAGCGGQSDNKVYGPEDYQHFSSYFTMEESTANEMMADGGTPMVSPGNLDSNAAVLSGDAPFIQSAESQILTSEPADSASIASAR